MRRTYYMLVFILFTSLCFSKEVRPVKNVILMIPDGTNTAVYSAARWYKVYNKMGDRLHMDPYFTGTVTTFSSNAPIGDSAPTTSCYMTGIPSRAGWVSTYPLADPNDLFESDSAMAYQPLATILEASRIEKNKATGLVVTSHFTDATPADCAAHHYNRGNSKALASQMAYQNLDVMFGGGNGILTDDIKQHFRNSGTTLIQNDRKSMLNYNGTSKVWALFGDKALPFDIDRENDKVPSLSEMTEKALEILSKNENGFFLMVEGSQVDWAAHQKDPVAIITEFIAFDEAVGKAIDFAKNNDETAIIVLADHGTGGFSIGKSECRGYNQLSLEELFGEVSKYKLTSAGLEEKLIEINPENIKSEYKKYTDIDLTDDELKSLLSSKNYKGDKSEDGKSSSGLRSNIIKIMNDHMCFGFTTYGHTGEEVLLASYHPDDNVLRGNVKNTDVNNYLYKVSGLSTPLPEMTQSIFAKHTDVFYGLNYLIENKDTDIPILVVKKGKSILKVPAFSSIAELNGIPFNLGSVTVYIDKNETFYLPKDILDKLK